MNCYETQYADTKTDAISFALAAVNGLTEAKIESVFPDPWVNGVWGIKVVGDTTGSSTSPSIVVYLKGHGSADDWNDFECNEYAEVNL